VRHGAAENEAFGVVSRLDLDRHTHIEGASNPLAFAGDDAAVLIAELQVVSGKSLYFVSLPPQLSIELLQSNRGGGSKDNVVVSFFRILVCD